MRSTTKDLLEIIEEIPKLSIFVVGDLILDRYIWGAAERISPEAPVPVVAVTRTEDRLGGAGNVVSNLTEMGVSVTVGGLIGNDLEGEAILNLLNSDQTSCTGVLIVKGRPTSVKTRVIARAQQVVRVDREETSPHSAEMQTGFAQAVERQLPAVNAIIVSDYGKGAISEIVWSAFTRATKAGILNSQNRPLVLDPHPANYHLYDGVAVAKPNRKEAEAAAGMSIKSYEDAVKAANILRARWNADRLLITLGELGLTIVPGNGKDPVSLDTRARDVFDVSGAGDCVTALYTAAIAAGASPELAGDLANIGAGIVVSEVGTVPIGRDKLIAAIEAL